MAVRGACPGQASAAGKAGCGAPHRPAPPGARSGPSPLPTSPRRRAAPWELPRAGPGRASCVVLRGAPLARGGRPSCYCSGSSGRRAEGRQSAVTAGREGGGGRGALPYPGEGEVCEEKGACGSSSSKPASTRVWLQGNVWRAVSRVTRSLRRAVGLRLCGACRGAPLHLRRVTGFIVVEKSAW